MKNYKLILFDADGTLFDFNRAEREAFMLTMRQYNINSDCFGLYRQINEALWRGVEQGLFDNAFVSVERFVRLLSALNSSEEPEDVARDFMENLGSFGFLLDDAHRVVEELSGRYDIVVATNGIPHVQKKRFSSSSIAPFIKDIVVSMDAGASKPSPVFFDYVFNKHPEYDKDSAIMIGDSLHADIKGAADYGIDSIFVDFAGDKPIDENMAPTYTVNRLIDLLTIL